MIQKKLRKFLKRLSDEDIPLDEIKNHAQRLLDTHISESQKSSISHVRLSLPVKPDFSGTIEPEWVKVDLEDLKNCGWEYCKTWLEESREGHYKWANAFHNLKRAVEGNEA